MILDTEIKTINFSFFRIFFLIIHSFIWGDLEGVARKCPLPPSLDVFERFRLGRVIGDLPVGAGVAMATRDMERNLSTRNQNVMNKELFTITRMGDQDSRKC